MRVNYNKPFYLIAKYWLDDLQGFITICDDKEEAKKIFAERYGGTYTLGVTEESYKLLEVNAKVIMTDSNCFEKMEDKDEIN